MNLAKMFETQKILRDRINYNEPDRLDKLILALLVELGECANELPEVFKFWSHKKNNYKRALVEYVDGLHFVLDIGLHLGFQNNKPFLVHTNFEIGKMFLKLYKIVSQLEIVGGRQHKEFYFGELLSNYLGLGKMLGFTWEEIETAYYMKNAVNHARQENGY